MNTSKAPAKPAHIIRSITGYLFLFVLLIFFLFPFFVMVTRSIMTDDEILRFPRVLPTAFYFGSYLKALDLKSIYWFGNTFIIAAINMVSIPLSASLCAYGFAKLKMKGKDLWFSIVLATIMLPAITMQIPLYVLYSDFGWIGTWLPMTVPGFFGGGAMNIFLLRQFMRGVPNQLNEAARIDGANKFTIYLKIVLPICKPILIYIIITTFLGVWNDFMTPLMYLSTNERMYTISLGLYMRFNEVSGTYHANSQMATGVIMLLPCMLIFFLFQKHLIGGIALGGVKG